MRLLLPILCSVFLLGGWMSAQSAPARFTGDQARAGRTAYNDSCATCHTASLVGGLDAPPLAGDDFQGFWGGRPARELLAYVKAAMPPAGRKPDDTSLESIVAYILERNGMSASTVPFDDDDQGVIQPSGR